VTVSPAQAEGDPRPRLSPRRLASETVLYGLAGGLGKALALITVPILSRTLGPGDYGLADLAIGFSALAVTVVMFAGDIPAARLRGRAPSAAERQVIITNWVVATVVVATLATLLLVPFAGLLAADIWAEPGQSGLALLSILLIPIAATQAALANVLRIEGRAVASVSMAIVDLVAQLGLAIALVLAGLGPTGVVLGFIAGSTIGLVAAAVVAAPHFVPDLRLRLAAGIVTAGLAFLPASTVTIAAEYVVRSEVALVAGTAAVGHFAVAIRLASVMLLVSAAFSLAWGPHGLQRRPGAETTRVFGAVLELFTVGAVAAAVAGAALAPEIVVLISGPGFLPAAEALPGLILAAAMTGVFSVLVIAAGMEDRRRVVPIAAIAGGVAQVVLTAVLIGPLGLAGVGIGALAARSLSIALLALDTTRTVGRRPMAWASLAIAVPLVVLLQVAAQAPAETFGLRVALVVLVGLALVPLWHVRLRANLTTLGESHSAPAESP
jgi:O-antigen/teichoic acid export membrane protein